MKDLEAGDAHRRSADLVLILVLFLLLAQEMGEKQTTQAPAAQHATSNQDAREPVILTAATFLLFAAFVLILLLVPLAKETGEKQTTQAPTA